jgi:hypothetical protein
MGDPGLQAEVPIDLAKQVGKQTTDERQLVAA